MSRVLVIDDEAQIRRMLRTSMTVHGYEMVEAADGREALDRFAPDLFDLVILDLGLPDRDGLDVLRDLRGRSDVPVLVLTVREREEDKVAALDAGADDYVTKPFGIAELLARLRALARRRQSREAAEPVYRHDRLHIDLVARRVTVDDREVRLTPKQFDLLHALASDAGRVLTHQQLLARVWGPGHVHDVQYLRVFMRQLRALIEEDPARPRHLLTELGVGYRMAAPPP